MEVGAGGALARHDGARRRTRWDSVDPVGPPRGGGAWASPEQPLGVRLLLGLLPAPRADSRPGRGRGDQARRSLEGWAVPAAGSGSLTLSSAPPAPAPCTWVERPTPTRPRDAERAVIDVLGSSPSQRAEPFGIGRAGGSQTMDSTGSPQATGRGAREEGGLLLQLASRDFGLGALAKLGELGPQGPARRPEPPLSNGRANPQ